MPAARASAVASAAPAGPGPRCLPSPPPVSVGLHPSPTSAPAAGRHNLSGCLTPASEFWLNIYFYLFTLTSGFSLKLNIRRISEFGD